ncbi:MAG: nucleotidyltransferase family protein [Rhodocyclaceae bacterium]|nr:nucleotidyltransferase family protein [Rhodocyclaceae bacterium]
MKAMILAAGRGERMRPLTDTCPKPLLAVGGKPLIVWHLERLAAAGFVDVIINHAHLGALIEKALGNGQRWRLNIQYSPEPEGALETAGGIAQALPLLGDAPFLVINGDIFCDWNPALAVHALSAEKLAHLVMVPNPPQHPNGDFCLDDGMVGTLVGADDTPSYTFSGIGIYRPEMFANILHGSRAKLAPLLVAAMATNKISGELHSGTWLDIGTPDRLTAVNQLIAKSPHG